MSLFASLLLAAAASVSPAPDAQVAFVGDTQTWQWKFSGKGVWRTEFVVAPYRAVNLGENGLTLAKAQERVGDWLSATPNAKAYVVSLGNVDVRLPRPAPLIDTVLDADRLVKRLLADNTNAVVVLMPVWPAGATPDDSVLRRADALNGCLSRLSVDARVFWCDCSSQLKTPSGRLPRGVMPGKNYEFPAPRLFSVWAAAVKPYLDFALARTNLPTPPDRLSDFADEVPDDSRPSTCIPEHRINGEVWGDERWWLKRLGEKREQALREKEFDLVMLGDSITHTWEWERRSGKWHQALTNEFRTLNLGFSGDRVEHLLWRLENGQLDGYRAKSFALMVGTNNYLDRPEDVAAGIKAVLELVTARHPESKVILMPIFPRGTAKDPTRAKNEKTNALIRPLADGKKVVWLDFNARFLDAEGDVKKMFPDRLHPNLDGFGVWYENLSRQLRLQ